MKALRKALAVALALFIASEARASASELFQTAKLFGSESVANDSFGFSVALDGDVAIVGAVEQRFTPGPGAAYIYRWNGSEWIEEQVLRASDGADGDAFGHAVDVRGDVAVVGSINTESAAGAVYTFRYDGSSWVEEQKLTASDGNPQDIFGVSLDLDGDVLLVGAPSAFGTNNAGYIFRYDGSSWAEEEKLLPGSGSNAGFAVALSGDVAILGDQTDNSSQGRAIVFRFDGVSWQREFVLQASDGSGDDFFGASLSVDGDVAFVGALQSSPQGATYVFRYDGVAWLEEQKLTPSDGSLAFGCSVVVDGDVAVVGACSAEDATGAVYLYHRVGVTWSEGQRLTANDGDDFDQLGSAVAWNDGRVFASAVGDETNRGSAYVFSRLMCFDGVVNVANDPVTNVLFVDGSTGGSERRVLLREGQSLSVTLQRPVTGGSGRFVLHVNEGEPTASSEAVLPAAVGRSCFPFLLSRGADPVIIANNLGRTAQVGASHYFGAPAPDPDLATTTLFYPDFPVGTTWTLQAVIVDPGALSSKGASVTNAVMVTVL